MQGVVKAYDPASGLGSLLSDSDGLEIDLAADALLGSSFRFLRQGQRVVFQLDENSRATQLSFGSEGDMKTRSSPPPRLP